MESGYHRVIDEHISFWIAVEEDIVESYAGLIARSQDVKIKETLGKIVEDSRRHAQMLRQVSETFKQIILDEEKHAKLIRALAEKAHED